MEPKARSLVKKVLGEAAPVAHDLVWVFEDGTADPFYAIYVDGKLVAENPRGDVRNVLDALAVPQRFLYVQHGFEGTFPAKLTMLKTFSKPG